MKPTCCRCLCVLLWIATGCTYNPVRYDPVTGFQTGGGVGVLCGGPLDPWMLHCDSDCDCCLTSCLCGSEPACYPAPVCAPVCPPAPVCVPGCPPAPICAPVCPPVCSPACPMSGIPMGSVTPYSPLPSMPNLPPTSGMMPQGIPVSPAYSSPSYSNPPALGSGLVPTFAAPCPTCGPGASASAPGYPQTVPRPLPGVTNYPQLFQNPPPAPPADPYMMPTPIPESELPSSAEQLPPHYEMMETPSAGQPAPPLAPPATRSAPTPAPTPQTAPQQNPMQGQAPAQQPMPTPMPMGTNPAPQPMPTPMPMGANPTTQNYNPGAAHPRLMYDARRQQWVPVRL